MKGKKLKNALLCSAVSLTMLLSAGAPVSVFADTTDAAEAASEAQTEIAPTISLVYNGVDYSPVFNPAYYLSQYPDLQKAYGTDEQLAFNHFLRSGMREGRTAKATFNVYAYANRYPDLQQAFQDDLAAYYRHYCELPR